MQHSRGNLTFLFLTFSLIKLLPKQLLLPPLIPTAVLIHRGAKCTSWHFLQSIKGSLVVGRGKRWLLFLYSSGSPGKKELQLCHTSAIAATAQHPSVLKAGEDRSQELKERKGAVNAHQTLDLSGSVFWHLCVSTDLSFLCDSGL